MGNYISFDLGVKRHPVESNKSTDRRATRTDTEYHGTWIGSPNPACWGSVNLRSRLLLETVGINKYTISPQHEFFVKYRLTNTMFANLSLEERKYWQQEFINQYGGWFTDDQIRITSTRDGVWKSIEFSDDTPFQAIVIATSVFRVPTEHKRVAKAYPILDKAMEQLGAEFQLPLTKHMLASSIDFSEEFPALDSKLLRSRVRFQGFSGSHAPFALYYTNLQHWRFINTWTPELFGAERIVNVNGFRAHSDKWMTVRELYEERGELCYYGRDSQITGTTNARAGWHEGHFEKISNFLNSFCRVKTHKSWHPLFGDKTSTDTSLRQILTRFVIANRL